MLSVQESRGSTVTARLWSYAAQRTAEDSLLSNREIATLCWLGIAVLWVLNKKTLRPEISRLLKLFLQPPIIFSLLAMFAWIGCELWIGNWLSLWSTALAKGTVLWAVGTAIVLFFNCLQAASDPANFVKQTMSQVVGVVVFVEFFINLYVMSLPVELVLQPRDPDPNALRNRRKLQAGTPRCKDALRGVTRGRRRRLVHFRGATYICGVE